MIWRTSSLRNRSPAELLDTAIGTEPLAAAAGAELLAAPLGSRDTTSPLLGFSVDSTRLANQLSTRSSAASDLSFVSSSSAKQLSNLLRHSSVCARAVVFVITDLQPGHAVSEFLHVGLLDVHSARCTIHRCSRRFHGVPFNVMRSSKSQRSNSGRLRTVLVLYTPLVVMISISSLRSLIPMNAPSCHLGSNFACLAPPGRIGMKYTRSPNSTSCLRYGLPACNCCASVTTNLIPRHPSPRVFHEKCQDGMSRRYFAFHALFKRTLHHSYLFLYFTHRPFNGTVRLMLFNQPDSPPSQIQLWASTLEPLA